MDRQMNSIDSANSRVTAPVDPHHHPFAGFNFDGVPTLVDLPVPALTGDDCQMELLDITTGDWSSVAAPMAVAGDFDIHDYRMFENESVREECTYQNAATCPDCSAGMIRQGRCCVCPSCGFETCLN